MEQLASLDNDGKKRYLVVGGDENTIDGIFKHYSELGLKVACLCIPKEVTLEDCDLIISQVFWDDSMVYLSPIKGEKECPDIIINKENLTHEQVMDQVQGFLEAIGF